VSGARSGGSRRAADQPPALESLVAVPTYRDQPATLAADVSGLGLRGERVDVRLVGTGRRALLLFLSTGCQGCRQIWEVLADPVGNGLVTDEVVVAITHDPGRQDLAALRSVVPAGIPVVMSSAAWTTYRVQGPPFYALVDGSNTGGGGGRPIRVVTEGVAWGAAQIADDVRRARSRA
jgi:hypothetical protein